MDRRKLEDKEKGIVVKMYLIIGANGFLGRYCIQSVLERTTENIVATARKIQGLDDTPRVHWVMCDIARESDFDSLLAEIKGCGSIKVIFLAAYHNPDLVAQNPKYAWNINVTMLSQCMNKMSFVERLFYASTDSVYGNSIDNYHFKETDALNPVNMYGRNKAAAEAIVRYLGFHVVRFPFLIGPSLVPGKKHFYDKIVEDLSAGKEVEMFENSYRSSLSFHTAAGLLVDLIRMPQRMPPILNVCGDKDLSKYEIGLMIADSLQVSSELVKPIKIFENDGVFKTKRAVSTLMDNSLAKEVLHVDRIDFRLL